jgi:PAS domain S-box-containing protein
LLRVWNTKVGECAPEHISRLVTDALAFSGKKIELKQTCGEQVFLLLFTPVTVEGYVNIYANDITEREKAEEELQAVSLYSRNLIEVSLDPLVTISKEGKITDLNKATEDVTGYSRTELIGTDFSNYFTEPEMARTGYQKVFTEGLVKDYQLAIRHKSGRITDVLYNATTYRNAKGDVQGVFAAARDITERKKVEEELRKSELKYRSIFENSQAGMFRTRLDGSEILDCNGKFLNIFGRSRDEVLGKPSLSLWANPLERQDMVRKLKAKGFAEDFECKMLNKKGEVRLCLTALKLYPEEEILEGSIIDITERRNANGKTRID